jgi:2'-hydroxyisoflavone reductase
MDGEYAGASLTRTDRAEREGLRTRPLDETIRDTLAWHATRPAERQQELRSGLTPEREAALLAACAARQTS